MAAKTKAAPKRAAKKVAKPKAAKPKAKTTAAKKKAAPRRKVERAPQFADAAKIATDLVTVGSDGKPIGRAPIGTPQMARVHAALVGKRQIGTVVRAFAYGGPKFGQKETVANGLRVLRQYAGAKIGRTDLPEGASTRLSVGAAAIGDPKVHKVNGRALAAALVALADAPPAKKAAAKK